MRWVLSSFIFLLPQANQPLISSESEPGKDVPYFLSAGYCKFTFEDKKFLFASIYGESTQFTIATDERVVFFGHLCRPIWDGSVAGVFSLDIDGNGYEDIVLKSYILGSTGSVMSIVRYNVFLFSSQDRVRYVDVSTFRDVDDSFSDLDDDGTYEFISRKRMLRLDGERYYLKNIFKLSMEGVVNVTDQYPEFFGAFQFVDESKEYDEIEVDRAENIFSSPVFVKEPCDKRNW